MISAKDMDRIDRQIRSNVSGRRKILAELLAAGRGWNHTSGRDRQHEYEQWKRGRWTLRVEWSEGGRIHGAGLHEDQVDPDTGRIAINGDGSVKRYLRFGLVAGQRRKKEELVEILAARPEDIPQIITRLVEEHIVNDRRRRPVE